MMRPPRYFSLLIAGYLAFQVLYPIRGLVADKFDSWGTFTWNMYTQRYDCRSRYRLVDESGQEEGVDFLKYFNLRDEAGHVFFRQALPRFHQFLCDQLAREGKHGRLLADSECTRNRVETRSMIRSGVDICTAANFAVAPK